MAKYRWLIVVFAVIFLAACQPKGVFKTPEGIPRKIIVRQDNTDVFDSPGLVNSIQITDQWEVWYVFGESETYYMVAGDLQEYPEFPRYIRASDVFEWNTYFCFSFKNSPHESGRNPSPIYETLEGARNKDQEDINLIEKEEHGTDSSPIIMLSEYDGGIYKIATLYDDVNEEGNYVFLGHYDFGYLWYSEEIHEFRRYVSKQQLAEQLRVVLGIVGESTTNMNPSEKDKLYGPLIGLLAEFESVDKGIEDIFVTFSGPDVPSAAQTGIFDPDVFIQGVQSLDPELAKIADEMLDYLENPAYWNENGYAYIPAEWMEP